MSAILRISGSSLDAEACIATTSLPAVRVYERGTRRFPLSKTNRKRNRLSGVNFRVTPRDGLEGRLLALAEAASAVLTAHRREVQRLRRRPDVESVVLDIGIPRLDVAGQFE